MFPSTTYIQRRQQLINTMSSGIILLMGNEDSPMNYTDNVYHFRQDSNFLYYIGLNIQHLAAIIDIDEGTTTLFGNDITIDHIVWMGEQPTTKELGEKSGITATQPYNTLIDTLQKAQSSNRAIHYLPPYRAERIQRLHTWLNISLNAVNQGTSIALIKAVVAQRSIKSEAEIIEMERALTTTGRMHHSAMLYAKAGMTEAEVTGIVQGQAVSGGGGLAYPIILTVNGQTLHNHYHGNILKEGQLILGDFGADTAMNYAGDITRTFPVGKTFTTRQKEIYEIVLDAEMSVIEAMKPGLRYMDMHLYAAKIMATGLKDLGLMKGDINEAVAQGAHALFFPHGLGHAIGLDVHDMEDLGEDFVGYDEQIKRSAQFGLRSLRFGKEMKEGNVLTVEPGLYFIPQLIDAWRKEGKFKDFINYEQVDTYKDFSGIRIEDNVLVTATGSKVLGAPIAKTVKEIETMRGGRA